MKTDEATNRELRQTIAALQSAAELPAPLATRPSLKRWRALQARAQEALQMLSDEMTTYQEERSEKWQEGENGEAFQEALSTVDSALDIVNDLEFP